MVAIISRDEDRQFQPPQAGVLIFDRIIDADLVFDVEWNRAQGGRIVRETVTVCDLADIEGFIMAAKFPADCPITITPREQLTYRRKR